MHSLFRHTGDVSLRARRGRQGYTSVPIQELKCDDGPLATLGRLPCAVFLAVCALFLAVGIVCCVTPPRSPTSAVGEQISDTAFCMRAQRQPDFVKVQLAIGTPARIVPAPLRPDRLVPRGAGALRVFSPRTVESSTLRCTAAAGAPAAPRRLPTAPTCCW